MSYTPPSPDQPGDYGPPGGGYGQQPGYGPQSGYGPPVGYGGGTTDHPQGTTILLVGILSLVFTFVCGIGALFGPVAWIMGNNAIKEIDASPGRYGNRGQVQAGRICGIIASVLLVIVVISVILLIAAGDSSATN